jgi:hypothetical protein
VKASAPLELPTVADEPSLDKAITATIEAMRDRYSFSGWTSDCLPHQILFLRMAL